MTSLYIDHIMTTRNISVFSIVLGLLAGGYLTTGCDILTASQSEESKDEMLERLQIKREQWENHDIEDYRLKYSQQVGEVLVNEVSVFVSERKVDSVQMSRDDVSRDGLLVETVSSFFDLIEARVGEESSQFSVNFDTERRFPTRYTADFENRPSQTVLTISLADLTGTSN